MKISKQVFRLISVFLFLSSIGANVKATNDAKQEVSNKKYKNILNNSNEIKSNDLSVIFDLEPTKWGLRGDPWFWRYLKDLFEQYDTTISTEELEKIIKDEHKKLTGENLDVDSCAYCSKFDHGGMSHGGLYGKFWVNEAIPLLKNRLEKLQL